MHKSLVFTSVLVGLIALGGCSSNKTSAPHPSSEVSTEHEVTKGVVESLQLIKVKTNDKARAGLITGALVGNLASGNGIHGIDYVKGFALTALGAYTGKKIQQNLTSVEGIEIGVLTTDGNINYYKQALEPDQIFVVGERVKVMSDGKSERVVQY